MIYKPHIESVPLKIALAWSGANYLFEEKIDGRWTELAFQDSLVIGETCGGKFWPFDVVTHSGQDLRNAPLQARRLALDDVCAMAGNLWPRPRTGQGGEFLEAILASGGEGVVAKELGQPYGRGWFKAKRCQVFYCVVIGKAGDGRQAVTIAHVPFQDVKNYTLSRREKLENAGKLALRGERFDAVRIGSILKVEAFGKHPSGLLREARLDQDAPDSWLVKY